MNHFVNHLCFFVESSLIFMYVVQQSLAFWGTGFIEDNFPLDRSGGWLYSLPPETVEWLLATHS